MLKEVASWLRFGAPRTLPTRDAYALWADRYPPWAHNPLMRIEQGVVEPILASMHPSAAASGVLVPPTCPAEGAVRRRRKPHRGEGGSRTSPERALDVGTGSGRNLPLLAATGARVVAGVDFSLPMLGRRADGRPRVCGDACRLPFRDAGFDLLLSSLMVGDIADVGACIAEFGRVLSRGGQLIYSDFHPSWAAEGWRRTFETVDGRRFALPYFPHAIADHVVALERCAFGIRAIHEPTLPARERSAGRVRAGAPVLAIFHAVKQS